MELKDTSDKQKMIMLRQVKVQRYALRKLSIPEIANQLGVDEKTVDRDLATIRERNLNALKADLEITQGIQNVFLEHIASIDELIRENWLNYHQPGQDVRIKTILLRNIKDLHSQRLDSLSKVGLIQPTILDVDALPLSQQSTSPDELKSLNDEFNLFIRARYAEPTT